MSLYFTRHVDGHANKLNNDIMGKYITSFHEIHLDQPLQFYQQFEPAIRNYLNKVYPMGKASFDQLNTVQIAKFFNSLCFYYNCAYSNHDIEGLTGPKPCWSALDCVKIAKLPFVPQGYFYDWKNYQRHDLPVTYSDSTRNVADFGSERPSVPWGLRADGGEVGRSQRSGPAPEWVVQRKIYRNVYYPLGLYYSDHAGWEVIDSCDAIPYWQINPIKNGYIEVTHMDPTPGMSQSPGTWYNGTPGSGIFYSMGKYTTHNNKFAAVFQLIEELSKKSATELGLNYSGAELLRKYYNSDDPYQITWNLFIDGNQKYFQAMTGNNTYLIDPKVFEGFDNKGVLSASGLMNPGKIGCQSKPYGPNAVITMKDIVVYYQKKYCIGDYAKKVPNMKGWRAVVKAAIENTDYFANRVGTIVINDEVMFWAAVLLNYDTIYLPFSANSNGYWQTEILNCRLPHQEAINKIKTDRQYIYTHGPGYPTWPSYHQSILNMWWPWETTNFLSIRDPLNINGPSKICSGVFNGEQLGCIGTMSEYYKTLPMYEVRRLNNELPLPPYCPNPPPGPTPKPIS